MTGTTAQWLAAAAGVLTALAAIGGVLPALIKVLRQVRQVHVIVNQQRTDMTRYQNALIGALHAAGVNVPIDQANPEASLPDPPRLPWWQRR